MEIIIFCTIYFACGGFTVWQRGKDIANKTADPWLATEYEENHFSFIARLLTFIFWWLIMISVVLVPPEWKK